MFLGTTLTVHRFTWWQGGFESKNDNDNYDDDDVDENDIVRECGVMHGQNYIRKIYIWETILNVRQRNAFSPLGKVYIRHLKKYNFHAKPNVRLQYSEKSLVR